MNLIIVFTGPSGSGKTTLCDYLVSKYNFVKPRTFTTRSRRIEESHDAYHFVDTTKFMRKVKNNEMIEHVYNLGHYYGCAVDSFNSDRNIVVALDHRGASALKKTKFNVKVVLLEIDPSTLRDRIVKRSNLDKAEQDRRALELKQYHSFKDYDWKVDAKGALEIIQEQISQIMNKLNVSCPSL